MNPADAAAATGAAEQIPRIQMIEWVADARGRLGMMEVEMIELTARIEALEEMMTSVSSNLTALAPAVRERMVTLEARVQRLEALLLTALTAIDNHMAIQHRLLNEDVSGAIELLREALGRGS